jgi:hypothetical protein
MWPDVQNSWWSNGKIYLTSTFCTTIYFCQWMCYTYYLLYIQVPHTKTCNWALKKMHIYFEKNNDLFILLYYKWFLSLQLIDDNVYHNSAEWNSCWPYIKVSFSLSHFYSADSRSVSPRLPLIPNILYKNEHVSAQAISVSVKPTTRKIKNTHFLLSQSPPSLMVHFKWVYPISHLVI